MLPHPSLVFGDAWTGPPAPSATPSAPPPAPQHPPVPIVAPPAKRKPGRPPKGRSDLGGSVPGASKPRSSNSAVRQAHDLRGDSELVAALRARQRVESGRPGTAAAAATAREAEMAVKSIPKYEAGGPSQPAHTHGRMDDVKPSISQPLPSRGKAKKEPTDPMNIRPARHRKSCPKTVIERREFIRQERCLNLGSTGNVYTVTIGSTPDCDCPDCEKGNSPCKHIIFVFLKVLKVSIGSPIWYQKGITPAELNSVYAGAPAEPSASVSVNSRVRDTYFKATGKEFPAEPAQGGSGGKRIAAVGEDCPVCYDEMTQKDEDMKKLVYDESLGGCGRPLHDQCFRMWAATAKKQHKDVTCVWCRSPWVGSAGASQGKGKGTSKTGVSYSSMGYMNMAHAAGISPRRDTSTYYHGRGHRYDDD
ncbi:hypothetical protein B9479_002134 [Cryptococcus floricola]|uniref:SWIM-type domain-containing protein n=1 Tax=Cryptococcus floricola TaxID=2591691 RepID=A0A5D3B3M5_9TREE|nr:hypothetical protein B9479_002134 [Cryptococcus floricola]